MQKTQAETARKRANRSEAAIKNLLELTVEDKLNQPEMRKI